MATVRESHRRAAPLAAVDRIPWGDGAADIDPPRAPAIVFETSRTFSASLPQFQTLSCTVSLAQRTTNVYERYTRTQCEPHSDPSVSQVRQRPAHGRVPQLLHRDADAPRRQLSRG